MSDVSQTKFQQLHSEMVALQRAYNGGAATLSQVRAKAAEAAEEYNRVATEVAKKHGRRPKKVTAAALMR